MNHVSVQHMHFNAQGCLLLSEPPFSVIACGLEGSHWLLVLLACASVLPTGCQPGPALLIVHVRILLPPYAPFLIPSFRLQSAAYIWALAL